MKRTLLAAWTAMALVCGAGCLAPSNDNATPTPSATPEVKLLPLRVHPADPEVVQAVLQGSAGVSPSARDQFMVQALCTMLVHERYADLDKVLRTLLNSDEQGGSREGIVYTFIVAPGSSGYWEDLSSSLRLLHSERWNARSGSGFSLVSLVNAMGLAQQLRNLPPHHLEHRLLKERLEKFRTQFRSLTDAQIPQSAAWRMLFEALTPQAHKLEELQPELDKLRAELPRSRVMWESTTLLYARHFLPVFGAYCERVMNSDPKAFARLYASTVPRMNSVSTPPIWKWQVLQKGFEEVLQEQPQSVYLRNAYARIANDRNQTEVARAQLEQIGSQLDWAEWSYSFAAYQKACSKAGFQPLDSSKQTLPRTYPLPSTGGVALGLRLKDRWGTLTQVRDLRVRQQFAELEAIAEALRKQEPLRLQDFYRGVGSFLLGDRSGFEMALTDLQRWAELYPNSSTAQLALCEFYIRYAYLARGGGYASKVTDKGFKTYRERLQLAAECFKRAVALKNQDAFLFCKQVALVRNGVGSLEEAVTAVETSLKLHPDALEPLGELSYTLIPRWHGAPGLMARAADQLAKSTPLGDGVYPCLLSQSFRFDGPEVFNKGYASALDWSKVVRGMKTLDSKKLITPERADEFARIALYKRDKALAAHYLSQVKDQWSVDDWSAPDGLRAAKAWVEGRGPYPLERHRIELKLAGWKTADGGQLQTGIPPAKLGTVLNFRIRSELALARGHILWFKFVHLNGKEEPVPQSQSMARLPGEKLPTSYDFKIASPEDQVAGPWRFEVVDETGQILAALQFTLK